MRRSPLRWLVLLFLTGLVLSPLVSADDDDDDDDDDGNEATLLGLEGEATGEIAQVLLIGTLSIAVWRPLFKWLRAKGPELFDKEPRAFKKSLGVFNRRYMKAHNWVGLAAAVVGTAHGYVLEWHWTLWLGTAFMWVLVFSGYLLQWKWPPREFRKGARLLHMQRAMSIALVVLLVVGHGIVD
jgi:hypothetical protein